VIPPLAAMSSGFPIRSAQSVCGRLRVLALLYAFVFFMAGIFPALVLRASGPDSSGASCSGAPACSASGSRWLVAAVDSERAPSLPTAMNIGLAFEIASSYAIAAAEFADPMVLEMHHGMFGTLVGRRVDRAVHGRRATAPRRAVLAALASVSSVPVVIGLMIVSGCHLVQTRPGTVLLRARVPLPSSWWAWPTSVPVWSTTWGPR